MTQTKSFSVFSNLKSEAHLKIEGGKKPTKNSFTHFANKWGGGKHRINYWYNHSHPLIFKFLHIPSKQHKAEISTTFFNTRILLRLHR